MLKAINSLARLSGGSDESSNERLKPPKPPDTSRYLIEAVELGYLAVAGLRVTWFDAPASCFFVLVFRTLTVYFLSARSFRQNCRGYMTYRTATVSDILSMRRLQNMRRHICVNAVFPKLFMKLFFIFVAIAD
jgi:hypothetical protein